MAVSRILSNVGISHPRMDGHLSCSDPRARAVPKNCDDTRSAPQTCVRGLGQAIPKPTCSALHHMGFFMPPRLRLGRWALTPPFHPYRTHDLAAPARRFIFCDTIRPPRLSPKCPAHSMRHVALWSPDFPLPPRLSTRKERPSAISRKDSILPHRRKLYEPNLFLSQRRSKRSPGQSVGLGLISL